MTACSTRSMLLGGAQSSGLSNAELQKERRQMNDGVHDLHSDEADPFEALLNRAEKALKNGDDVGLEALAKDAIDAGTKLPRLDQLQRAAAKSTKFALIMVRKIFDETRAKLEREKQAQARADPSVAAAEEAARTRRDRSRKGR